MTTPPQLIASNIIHSSIDFSACAGQNLMIPH
jgi:hypothetical protein